MRAKRSLMEGARKPSRKLLVKRWIGDRNDRAIVHRLHAPGPPPDPAKQEANVARANAPAPTFIAPVRRHASLRRCRPTQAEGAARQVVPKFAVDPRMMRRRRDRRRAADPLRRQRNDSAHPAPATSGIHAHLSRHAIDASVHRPHLRRARRDRSRSRSPSVGMRC
jgi:hypothetical protein